MSINGSLLAVICLDGAFGRRFFLGLVPSISGLIFYFAPAWTDEPEKPPVDTHCYLADFKIEHFPWNPAECLNIEEVFKNYKYHEAILDWPKRTLKVKTFGAGPTAQEQSFIVGSDKKLVKKPQAR